MGGRGTYALGNNVKYQYETVEKINGIKVLEKINKTESRNLPEESHSSKAYLQINKDGSFSKYREYGDNHLPTLEIEFGTHRGEKTLHYHEYINGERQQAKQLDKGSSLYKNMNIYLEDEKNEKYESK